MDAKELLGQQMEEEEVKADPRGFLDKNRALARALVRALTLFDAARIVGDLAVERENAYLTDVSDNLEVIARSVLTEIGLKEEHIAVLLDRVKPLPWEEG